MAHEHDGVVGRRTNKNERRGTFSTQRKQQPRWLIFPTDNYGLPLAALIIQDHRLEASTSAQSYVSIIKAIKHTFDSHVVVQSYVVVLSSTQGGGTLVRSMKPPPCRRLHAFLTECTLATN